ncbi:MAG: hypothetical protein ACJ8FN_05580 [Sphingomicrobium sp.]
MRDVLGKKHGECVRKALLPPLLTGLLIFVIYQFIPASFRGVEKSLAVAGIGMISSLIAQKLAKA